MIVRRVILLALLGSAYTDTAIAKSWESGIHLAKLRCEYIENPVGIDTLNPRLSWQLETGSLKAEREIKQTAYQILVSSTAEKLATDQGDLWDSKKVTSDQSIQVEYAGKTLISRAACFWKVRVWDKHDHRSTWSKPAKWTMGLLHPNDWQASWIKPCTATQGNCDLNKCSWIWFPQAGGVDQPVPGVAYFRARLAIPPDSSVQRAFVVMCADNEFALFVNGKEALKGDDWKLPQMAEITSLLKAGENIFAVSTSNGGSTPNPAGLIGRVMVELVDGRRLALETGSAWKTYTREQPGWREGGFDDTGWSEAKEIAKYGALPWGQLASQDQENSPASWMRKELNLEAAPESVVASVNVMGYYELYVNGQKVSEEVLAPAVSDYSRRSFYRTYEITKFLHPGRNCVGLWLDKGWYRSGPIARMQLDLSVGGKSLCVGTDQTWTFAPSTHSIIGKWEWGNFGGERVDARREIVGWSEVECSKGEWFCVTQVPPPFPESAVSAQSCPPNRIGKIIPLVSCTALGNNRWELDFGTNLTGWMRLRLPQLDYGQRVVMHYADRRFKSPEGDDTPAGKVGVTSQQSFSTDSGEACYETFSQCDEFVSAGKPGEQFCSKFNYHGFRYVIVEGLPVAPKLGDAEALLIESDLEPVGTFECSNNLLNRIHQVNLWTLRCLNLGGYMVDCPHRERLGYGDGQVGIESLVMNRNAAAFYAKWASDWMDAQNPSTGEIPHTAPNNGGGGGPGWGGAGCVLPWKLYLYYADRRLLERGHEPTRRYAEWLDGKCVDGVLRSFGGSWDFIGDWVPPGRGMDTNNWPSKSAAELFNNCYYLYLMDMLVKEAEVLGQKDEAQAWRTKLNERRPLLHAAFYHAQKQVYALDEQAYQLMPLMTGMVPDDLRANVIKKLEDLIRVKNPGHLDTGMLGTYFLIQYLQETGRNDLLYTILNQETYPGWGYMLSQGATTFWEQWNGYWSQIHSCFTSSGGWFYQGLAGIRPDETAPGFKKIIIKPSIVGDLTWVNCSYDSIHGCIVSNWKRQGKRLTMDVTIPPNTSATVYVPTKDEAAVTESGKPANKADGLKFLRMQDSAAVYAVGSGIYRFQSTLQESRH